MAGLRNEPLTGNDEQHRSQHRSRDAKWTVCAATLHADHDHADNELLSAQPL
jgi:hypothetical protein